MSAVLDHLAANASRHVDELCAYLRFPSVSAQEKHAPDLRAAADWVASRLGGLGLETTLHETAGHPIVVARTVPHDPAKPTFLVYGHYDVQPPEPFELWKTPPFEPRIEDGNVYARGSCDNKGQHLAHIHAVEAYVRTGTPLPCNLTFLIEGEEEVGSTHLYSFLPAHKDLLACDAVVISDNGIPSLTHPALTYALRGIVALEVRVDGPDRDLHSGLFGGSLENPAFALCSILAGLKDSKGRVSVPGFYDDVAKLSKYERAQMAKIPFNERRYAKFLGVPQVTGEAGFTTNERRTARPTMEINGLTSGYQGQGSKTIVPSWASAKLTFRLVPNQKPARVLAAIRRRLKELCPTTVRLSITDGHGGEPYLVAPEGPLVQAGLKAMSGGFGREALLMREGGSIPIVSAFRKHLKADTLLLGMSLPDDNPHSPNEKFSLEAYTKGMRMAALLWPELSAAVRP
jgi:acetylornithine deacetylase/succinyl-diaminopimelate desuccinylase-like protein